MGLLYAHIDGTLRVFGTNATQGVWTSAVDTFVHRVTKPDETNSGPGTGIYANRPLNPAVDRVDANVVFLANGRVETTGGVLISSDGILANKVVNGTIDGRVDGKKIQNCEVRGYPDPPMNISANGGSRPLIKVLDHQVTTGGPQFEIEHTKVMPQTPSPHWEACVGNRGYRVSRSILRGTTDIFGAFGANSLGGYSNIRVEDSVFGYIVFWQAASGGIVHPSDIITHGELIQGQGNLGGIGDMVFDGNAMYARYDPAYGSTPTAPAAVPATVFILTCTPQGGSVPTQAAGTLEYNWMHGTLDRVLYDSVYYVNLGTTGSNDGNRVFAIRYNKVQRPLSGQKGIVMSTAVQGTSAGYYTENRYMDNDALVSIQGG